MMYIIKKYEKPNARRGQKMQHKTRHHQNKKVSPGFENIVCKCYLPSTNRELPNFGTGTDSTLPQGNTKKQMVTKWLRFIVVT